MRLRIELAGHVLELTLTKDGPAAESADDPTGSPPHELGTPMVVYAEIPEPVGFRMPPDATY